SRDCFRKQGRRSACINPGSEVGWNGHGAHREAEGTCANDSACPRYPPVERVVIHHPDPSRADELARFEPVLRARARRLIGARLRPVLASSDLLQETLSLAVRRFAELSGRPARQVLAWLLRSMQFRVLRYVRDHRAELAGRQ